MKYITSLYWSIQTLTTVGYGDVSAVTVPEQILAILWMIIGVGFYSLTISNISIFINDLNREAAILSNTLNGFNELI